MFLIRKIINIKAKSRNINWLIDRFFFKKEKLKKVLFKELLSDEKIKFINGKIIPILNTSKKAAIIIKKII